MNNKYQNKIKSFEITKGMFKNCLWQDSIIFKHNNYNLNEGNLVLQIF